MTGDFSRDEYAEVQRVLHQVGEGIRRTVATERLYVLSLGSNDGNAHVHWHLVPLPPGVPYEAQQLRFLDWGAGGARLVELDDRERRALAASLRAAIAAAADP